MDAKEVRAARLADVLLKTPLVSLIGRKLKLERSGRQYRGCCPFHGERSPSFYVYDDHFHCFGCGEHGDAVNFVMKTDGLTFNEALDFLGGDIDSAASKPIQSPAPPPRPVTPEASSDAWRNIWDTTTPAGGTPVETYLGARGCGGSNIPAVLRFHASCPRGKNERLPAMVALMTDPIDNQPVGVHRTFLRPDGAGKIEHGSAKMMLGKTGVIRLTPDEDVTTGLAICEGIETGLAIMRHLEWRAIWATGTSGGIAKFPVLAGLECLTIFMDLDKSGAGQKSATECGDYWRSAGKEVHCWWPPRIGMDWLDELTQGELA